MDFDTVIERVLYELRIQGLTQLEFNSRVRVYLQQVYAAGFNEGLKHSTKRYIKPVAIYDNEGNFVDRFESVQDASRKLGLSDSTIHRSLKYPNKHHAGGYTWKYLKIK